MTSETVAQVCAICDIADCHHIRERRRATTPSEDYAAGVRDAAAVAKGLAKAPDIKGGHWDRSYASGHEAAAIGISGAILALLPADQPAPAVDEWQPIETAPTDGTKFDAWCVARGSRGVRMTDVQMRGDGSGFGFVVHMPDGVAWQYLDARNRNEAIFPPWTPTHWRLPPAPPVSAAALAKDPT